MKEQITWPENVQKGGDVSFVAVTTIERPGITGRKTTTTKTWRMTEGTNNNENPKTRTRITTTKKRNTLAEDNKGEDKHTDDNDKEDKRKEDREEDGKEEDRHSEDRHEDHQEDKGYKKSQVSAPSNSQPSEDSLPKNTKQVEKFTKSFKEALVPTQREEKTRERKPTNKKGESSPGPKTTGILGREV